MFLIIATVLNCYYALLLSKLRPMLASERGGKTLNKITGSILMGMGLALVLFRKP